MPSPVDYDDHCPENEFGRRSEEHHKVHQEARSQVLRRVGAPSEVFQNNTNMENDTQIEAGKGGSISQKAVSATNGNTNSVITTNENAGPTNQNTITAAVPAAATAAGVLEDVSLNHSSDSPQDVPRALALSLKDPSQSPLVPLTLNPAKVLPTKLGAPPLSVGKPSAIPIPPTLSPKTGGGAGSRSGSGSEASVSLHQSPEDNIRAIMAKRAIVSGTNSRSEGEGGAHSRSEAENSVSTLPMSEVTNEVTNVTRSEAEDTVNTSQVPHNRNGNVNEAVHLSERSAQLRAEAPAVVSFNGNRVPGTSASQVRSTVPPALSSPSSSVPISNTDTTPSSVSANNTNQLEPNEPSNNTNRTGATATGATATVAASNEVAQAPNTSVTAQSESPKAVAAKALSISTSAGLGGSPAVRSPLGRSPLGSRSPPIAKRAPGLSSGITRAVPQKPSAPNSPTVRAGVTVQTDTVTAGSGVATSAAATSAATPAAGAATQNVNDRVIDNRIILSTSPEILSNTSPQLSPQASAQGMGMTMGGEDPNNSTIKSHDIDNLNSSAVDIWKYIGDIRPSSEEHSGILRLEANAAYDEGRSLGSVSGPGGETLFHENAADKSSTQFYENEEYLYNAKGARNEERSEAQSNQLSTPNDKQRTPNDNANTPNGSTPNGNTPNGNTPNGHTPNGKRRVDTSPQRTVPGTPGTPTRPVPDLRQTSLGRFPTPGTYQGMHQAGGPDFNSELNSDSGSWSSKLNSAKRPHDVAVNTNSLSPSRSANTNSNANNVSPYSAAAALQQQSSMQQRNMQQNNYRPQSINIPQNNVQQGNNVGPNRGSFVPPQVSSLDQMENRLDRMQGGEELQDERRGLVAESRQNESNLSLRLLILTIWVCHVKI
jgi:hypothetical protein